MVHGKKKEKFTLKTDREIFQYLLSMPFVRGHLTNTHELK